MAKSMTKTTSNKSTTTIPTQAVNTEEIVVVDETATIKENVESTPQRVEPKKFKETDAIDCVSITAGQLGMIGIKSGINYTWAGRGDVTAVEYQDLVAAIRSGKKHISAPFFIIQDKDFLAQFPQIDEIYSSIYSMNDLKDIFKLDASMMKKVIMELPSGAKESVKNIASSMISKGQLDSVQKIKILDEIFETKFMLMTELYK